MCNLFATLLQNELQSDIERFTTLVKHVLHPFRLLTSLNVGGKIRNVAFQLVLQQCWKTKLHVFCRLFFRTLSKLKCSYNSRNRHNYPA